MMNVLNEFRRDGKPVIHVKHSFSGKGYLQDVEELNEFYESVKPLPGEKVVHKNFPNAFLDTDLSEYSNRHTCRYGKGVPNEFKKRENKRTYIGINI